MLNLDYSNCLCYHDELIEGGHHGETHVRWRTPVRDQTSVQNRNLLRLETWILAASAASASSHRRVAIESNVCGRAPAGAAFFNQIKQWTSLGIALSIGFPRYSWIFLTDYSMRSRN